MGCRVSNVAPHMSYSTKVQEAKEGQSEIRRNVKYTTSLLSVPEQGVLNLQDLFSKSAERYAGKQCLGSFIGDDFSFMTYSQVQEEAIHLGSGIKTWGLANEVNEYKNYKMKLIGVFGKNRREWVILDIANILYGYTMVPFYDTLGPESIPFILNQTNIETMFLTADASKSLLKCKEKGKLQNLVLFDPLPEELERELKTKGYKLFKYEDVVQNGRIQIQPLAQIYPETMYTICYTSGTTGNPKGALITHGNFVSAVASTQITDARINDNDVHLSYLPLPHVMERLIVISLLYVGAQIGFYRGDPNLLKEDILKLRPTIFVSVPRLYNKFCDGIKAKISEVTGLKKAFVEQAISSKLSALRSEASYTNSLFDKAFEGVRQLFGGRCRLMVTGSAPIQQDVIDFLKIAACCPILEGYGQTESSALSFSTAIWDPVSSHLGGPAANTEFKLVDVPEMNYTAQDTITVRRGNKDEVRATPRGEICLRGPGVFVGYYKDPTKTAEALDSEGWLHTGDIGMITEQGGVKIIDRKKNIFKLSQGEYIAPEKIESVYNRVPGVAESFVYGDSLQSQIVAIIVPQSDYIQKQAAQMQIQGSLQELCQNQKMIALIQQNIETFGRQNQLNSLEIAKLIYLEPQPLQNLGCLTSTLKLQRHVAKQIFSKQIENLYKQKV
ncbi:unnamed protein product (macronuclear) [Paramecium tetraurelia]|uniref:AMP-dependent synthetase/ligase domain-containing protein n=1 Tax=Paramecium tetraurelia TaxID=5888 RepID=A0DCZ3_PARTE|nr:uncharacterized protein GSPATT00015769001 [Paramecium tetraurelia]CAK80910.1 unnamed protein product [Paramecium tetraurelia]|eukprot:XP_001448307.1 hypothetical protein (macronuclear) [Paramecium tetraurelia strain d4-2]